MHTAARPFASVGVSLAGAAAIAVAPVMAPTVSTQIHHMEAQIERTAVRLTAAVDPFAAFGAAFKNTVASLQTIVSTAQTNGPTPILTAALNNQLAALQDLLKLVSSPGSVKVDPSPQPAVEVPQFQWTPEIAGRCPAGRMSICRGRVGRSHRSSRWRLLVG